MNFLAPILRNLITGNLKTTVERTRNQLFCAVFIAVALAFALAFLSVAYYLSMSRIMDPIWVTLIGAAFWFIIAGAIFFLYRMDAKKKRILYEKQLREQKAELMTASALTFLPSIGKKIIQKKSRIWLVALPILAIAVVAFFSKKEDEKL